MPTCYMLIGLPGSGKSTLCEQLVADMPGIQVVNTDSYIEEQARKKGKLYHEVYREVGDDAAKWMSTRIRQLINAKESFIWDQTNVYASARRKKIAMLRQNKYEVVAIALSLSEEELARRLEQRSKEGGKHVSLKIIQEMKLNYELPAYEEKFKDIYLIGDSGAYVLVPPHNVPKP